MILDLWKKGNNSVHIMRVVNTDTKSYMMNIPERCLQLDDCLQQHQHFLPFIVSVYMLMGVGVEDTLKRISISLAEKFQQLYPRTCGYVKSRIVITFVRATHQCISGSRVPIHRISVHQQQWEDAAGINNLC